MVAVDVAFETEKDWTADIGVLQFVGISDHSQLINRETEKQHPMKAINGLEERLNSIDTTFNNISEKILNIEDMFVKLNQNIDNLKKFSENIATEGEVEEVLINE